MERKETLQSGPCAIVGRGELYSGWISARFDSGEERLDGGNGEELETHPWVPGIGVGAAGKWVAGEEVRPAAGEFVGEGVPVGFQLF